jgi:hypothetical protein
MNIQTLMHINTQPTTQEFSVSDSLYVEKTKFRVLLKFSQLQELLPPATVVKQALLNLTFLNWDPYTTYNLQARSFVLADRLLFITCVL